MKTGQKRVLLAAGLLLGASNFARGADQPTAGHLTPRPIHLLTVNDAIINPVVSEYVERGIDRAQGEGAQALILSLDTPGGLLSSTRAIVKEIMNAPLPVIVYVAPSGARAGSAGVFITLAAHVAAMAPSTNIGAAHPVEFGESPRRGKDSFQELVRAFKREEGKKLPTMPEKEAPDVMEGKILNDTVAWVSTIAEARHRNVGWAVRAVKESASIGEQEAARLKVVDFVAKDLGELLQKIDGRKIEMAAGRSVVLRTRGAPLVKNGFTLRQKILNVLINPNIAYLLMMLGFYGLLFEITHPGVWFPGVAGLIALILAFYAFHTLPTNYAGLALIVLAVALFVSEVMVTSYGLLTIVGIVCMLLGSLFLVDSTAAFMQLSLKIILPVVGATALVFIFLVSLAVKAQRQRSPVGREGLIGAIGRVVKPGKVEVAGELWECRSDTPLVEGEKVRIVSVEGMKLRVTRV